MIFFDIIRNRPVVFITIFIGSFSVSFTYLITVYEYIFAWSFMCKILPTPLEDVNKPKAI